MTPEQTQQAAPASAEAMYTIRSESIEAQGRSISLVIGERLCHRAVTKAGDMATIKSKSFKQLRDLARKECSGDPEYLSPQAPVLEAAFKLLFMAPNDGLSLAALHSALSDLWMTSARPRHISMQALARVLTQDTYYGIAQVA